MQSSSRAEGFADALRLLPIGGNVTAEIAALDRSLLLVAQRASAVDSAPDVGMWRTWKLQALVEAEVEARADASLALATIPHDRPDLRAVIELRSAGLDAFLARYPGRAG